jgi:predicted peptidase
VQTPWANGNYNLSSVPESDQLKAVHSLIDTLKTSKNIDTSRIYVTGISMGGFGTWDLISRHFDTFAAAAPICGGGPNDKFELLSNMPILTFHGDADATVPYAGTKAMVDGINAYGKKNIQFITYPGAGHNIWDKAFNHDNYILERFLFSKTK